MDYESRGQRFESFRARQPLFKYLNYFGNSAILSPFKKNGMTTLVQPVNHLDFGWPKSGTKPFANVTVWERP